MSQIGVSFTPSGGTPVYSFTFDNFGDNSLPRTYQSTASFSQSANGTTILGGPAFRQKYLWVISSLITTVKAAEIDEMFQAWDTDRANGLPAAVGVTDTTFGPVVNANARISTPPTYSRMSPVLTMVTFGLTEV